MMSTASPALHGRATSADFIACAERRDQRARGWCGRTCRSRVSIARRYQRDRRVPADDLRQVGAIELLKAIERFDPERGIDFKRFAAPTINGELKRYLRDFTWAVRPPRGLQERPQKMARDQLTVELGRSPTPAELACPCCRSASAARSTCASVTT